MTKLHLIIIHRISVMILRFGNLCIEILRIHEIRSFGSPNAYFKGEIDEIYEWLRYK